MKRKYLSILLIFLLSISLVACGNDDTYIDNEQKVQVEEENKEEGEDKVTKNEREILNKSAKDLTSGEIVSTYDYTEEDTSFIAEQVLRIDKEFEEIGKELEEKEEPKDLNKSDVPREYNSALNSAKRYADMDMSKAGVYDQLVSEHGGAFPEEAGQYAIDNLEANWSENALNSAKRYADMDMSTSKIYDQLISDHGAQFTEEEAQYAIDNLD